MKDRKIVDYIIVTTQYADDLPALVKTKIYDGYIPLGNVSIMNDGGYFVSVFQAMVKYSEDT